MKSKQHAIVTVIFAAFLVIIFYSLEVKLYPMLLAISAIAGGLMPDILERPNSPFHRDSFHSKYALLYSGMIAVITLPLLFFFTEPSITLIFFFSFAYFFHLFYDGFTKAGLPGFRTGHALGPKNPITEGQMHKIMSLDSSWKREDFKGKDSIWADKEINFLMKKDDITDNQQIAIIHFVEKMSKQEANEMIQELKYKYIDSKKSKPQ
ncbi:MAG: hypothetical protein NTY20_03730 [Candidatus Aenigmarchaeota archaeon]|nr:hypothetical protein [Candidatus Aenigmarchaeota archaeon]